MHLFYENNTIDVWRGGSLQTSIGWHSLGFLLSKRRLYTIEFFYLEDGSRRGEISGQHENRYLSAYMCASIFRFRNKNV